MPVKSVIQNIGNMKLVVGTYVLIWLFFIGVPWANGITFFCNLLLLLATFPVLLVTLGAVALSPSVYKRRVLTALSFVLVAYLHLPLLILNTYWYIKGPPQTTEQLMEHCEKNIIPHLEAYKAKHGMYPESLQEALPPSVTVPEEVGYGGNFFLSIDTRSLGPEMWVYHPRTKEWGILD